MNTDKISEKNKKFILKTFDFPIVFSLFTIQKYETLMMIQ
jgi:hypothetical protein